MIFVDRKQVPVPAALDGARSKGAKELARARKAFGPGGKGKTTFAAYKDRTVKEALTVLFKGKCAYCESFYAATQPMDVEHFRPKGGFIEKDALVQPGYWWLAAAWENLFPSCIDCNRRRQHGDDDDNEKAYGKENLFPVAGTRARKEPDDLDAEERLLIDPCVDDPMSFFEYRDAGVIARKKGLHKRRREMAESSLEVYGLVRRGLEQKRRDRQLQIFSQLEVVLAALSRLKASPEGPAERRDTARALRELMRMRSLEVEYTAMARFYIDSKLDAIRIFLDREQGAAVPAGGGADPDVIVRFIEAFAPATPSGKRDFDALND